VGRAKRGRQEDGDLKKNPVPTVVPQARPRRLPEEPAPAVSLPPNRGEHPLHHRPRGLELLPDPPGPVVEVRRADEGQRQLDEEARAFSPGGGVPSRLVFPPRGDAGCCRLVRLVSGAYREADGDGLARGAA